MLFYPAALPLSRQTLTYTAGIIRCHRQQIGSLWRKLGRGAVHNLTAARIWGIIRELASSGLIVLADKGYTGAGDHIRTPYKGRNKPASQKDANRAHARLRGPGERAGAQLKSWHILRKLRCCPWKAGQLARAIMSFRPARCNDEQGSGPAAAPLRRTAR
jgi:hypothetical protein